MKFKEWFQLDEVRFKGLMRQWKAMNPNVPDYVLHQMYTNHLAPGMSQAIAPAMTAQEPTSYLPAGETDPKAKTMYHRPKMTPRYSPNTSSLNKKIDSPSQVIDRKNYIQGVNWTPKPIMVELRPDFLEPASLSRLVFTRFGYNPVDAQVRNDTARFQIQGQLASQRQNGENEPIILIKLGDNYYELLEGYHRTASYLLQGAPREDLEAIRQGKMNDLNYRMWKPVRVKAYVGSHDASQLPSSQPQYSPVPLSDPEATTLQKPPTPRAA